MRPLAVAVLRPEREIWCLAGDNVAPTKATGCILLNRRKNQKINSGWSTQGSKTFMNKLKGKTSALFSLVLFISLLVVVNSHFALAQTSASISGRIEDVSGAGIPGATVTVTSVETGAARSVTADETGN